METVLDVYKQPYDPLYPVVCMDESPKQLIGESRIPVPAKPGRAARYDYEYVRNGTCNIFIATEPLIGKRLVKVTETRKMQDWSRFLADIASKYTHAEKITLVMDNLNTHAPGSLYETYAPEKAKALLDRFDFVHTPKHGSWLYFGHTSASKSRGRCSVPTVPLQPHTNTNSAEHRTALPLIGHLPTPTNSTSETVYYPSSAVTGKNQGNAYYGRI